MIEVHNLEKSHGAKTILDDVAFSVLPGEKVGLVSPNGSGKTTLLEIIAGLQEGDGGEVVISKERLGYLPQKLKVDVGTTVHDYLSLALPDHWQHHKFKGALAEVGMKGLGETKEISLLSGGQGTRLALAKLLLEEPTALLMDEPTNNLDLDALSWLESFVSDFKGMVLVISHDRAFLDNTVERILELDPFTHKVNQYVGGYTDFTVERAARMKRELAEYERFEKKRKKMEEWIALRKQMAALYGSPAIGSQVQAMKKRYEREIEDSDTKKPRRYKGMKLGTVAGSVHRKKQVFKVRDITYKGIVSCRELDIFGHDRIHLTGRNGSGKTTLLRMLMGVTQPDTGSVGGGENMKIGYFSQEYEVLDEGKSVMDELISKSDIKNEPQARKLLGRYFFFGNHVYRGINSLSWGERVKLVMAILTNQGNHFLVMDEPTNHLDLESREVLESVLRDYGGGFIVVSHDRYFTECIATNRHLLVEGGTVREWYKKGGMEQ